MAAPGGRSAATAINWYADALYGPRELFDLEKDPLRSRIVS